MILKTLVVNNFRQISGEYKIRFASPGSRNVTVVLGENGSGKSTLLNAIRWCLYGSVELENPEESLSHFAVYNADVGDRISVEVILNIEHDNVNYSIVRTREYEKIEGGEASPVGEEVFRITHVASNGETKTVNDPVGFTKNLLPENLARFFFFQGESILQLALQRSREQLREGVETFLEFKVLDNAIRHLKGVESEFEQQLKSIASADVREVQAKIDQAKSDIDELEQKRAQVQRNIAANISDTELKKQRLGEVEQFRPLLQEISNQEVRLEELERQRKDATLSLCELVSENGFLAFGSNVLSTPASLANDAVEKGELPAKIKPQFVADLIDKGKCICGNDIDEAAKEVLEDWRGKTGLAELEEAIADIRRSVFVYDQQRRVELVEKLPLRREHIAKIQEEIHDAIGKKSVAEREITSLHMEEDEIHELQEAYDKLKNQLIELRVDESRLSDKINAKNEELEKHEEERKSLTKTQKDAQIVGRRIEATKNVRKALSQVRADWSQFVQGYLDKQLKTAWGEVAQLPRRVAFNEDFSLSIEERGGSGEWITSAPSEANCAVLALTFVSALIRFAREVGDDKNRQSVFSGGEFPLVMDAPFAKMDVEFKQKVPRGLASTVPQIVLICSLDQWQGEVEECLGSSVARAYALVLHKPGDEEARRQVNAFQKEIDYVVTDRDITTDWSEIQEVIA